MIRLGKQPQDYIDHIADIVGGTDYLGKPYALSDGSIMIPVEGRGTHLIIKENTPEQWTWKLVGMDTILIRKSCTGKTPEELAENVAQSILKTVKENTSKDQF